MTRSHEFHAIQIVGIIFLMFIGGLAFGEINNIQISNPSSSSATVSWITADSTDGCVRYGLTMVLGDTVCDSRPDDDVHFVEIIGLGPDVDYYFEVASDGEVDDNGGSYYTFRTTEIGVGIPYILFGQVYYVSGATPAEGEVVSVWVRSAMGDSSYPLSCLTDAIGMWIVNLGNLKDPGTNGVFGYSTGDSLFITAEGSADGHATTVDTVTGIDPQECDSMILYGLIHSAFLADTTEGFAPFFVQFADSSEGIIESWWWQFGDGGESFDTSPDYTYLSAGGFDVTLEVCGPAGCDTFEREKYVQVWADTIEVENTSAAQGDTGKVVQVWGTRSDSLMGYKVALHYDTSVMVLDRITLDGTCGEGADSFFYSDTAGYVAAVAYMAPETYIPPGRDPLLNLVFDIDLWADTGIYVLDLENDLGPLSEDNVFTTWDALEVGPILVDGELTITETGMLFIRADANSDSTISMSDAIYTLKYLYVPGNPEPTCMKTADTDDNGEVAMSDAIYTLKYLYVPGEPPPPSPCCDYPSDCGPDPTADELGCDHHPCFGKN